MLRTFVGFLCTCFAFPAHAKIGETVPQLLKRFGKSYTVESVQIGKKYKFRSANISVDAVVANGVSVGETYLSDHPLISGEPPNDIVRAVLKTNAPKARWVEIEAAPFEADYALRSSDNEYIAILKYTGPQPENNVWIMTVGLAKVIRALSSAASPSGSPSPPTAMPASTPLPFPSLSAPAAPTPHIALRNHSIADFPPFIPPRFEDVKAKAETGDSGSEYQLGLCYYKGDGVEKDFSEAVEWYRKAAEQGFAAAQSMLGTCYFRGEGVPKDFTEAVKWLRKAAERNNVHAQANLGLCYATGQGVPKDDVEGYKWGLLAAAKGNEAAKKNIVMAESRMTRDEIAQGQKLARDFTPNEMASSAADSSSVDTAEARPNSAGTGFFITEDGFLVTNAHVAAYGAQVRLLTQDGVAPAKVIKVDSNNDLALLKAQGRFAALPVETSRAVKLGDSVATIGFPNIGMQGFAPKFARGEIASLAGSEDDPRFFQISVPLQPGNSGGALVDEHGNVIGIVSAKLSAAAALRATGELPENVNYAVKSSFLLGFLESVPEVASKLKEPNTSDIKFAEVVEKARGAAVLVLVY
jgi:S1-C subfamily serine protease